MRHRDRTRLRCGLLPSGRKPAEGVSLFGVPLGQRDSDKEPMVRILEPHVGTSKVKVPKSGLPDEDIAVPLLDVGIQLLAASPDPADWVAPARQLVHTKLVKQRVL